MRLGLLRFGIVLLAMGSRASRHPALRCLGQLAVLPPAALLVHQLRFMLAFGSGSGAELQRTGHSYLHSLVPWIVLLLALAAGGFLRAVGRAFARQSSLPRYTFSLAGLWVLCSVCLLSIYVVQEGLEGWFATGHPAGLVGIFGYGGWWAVPASVCVGLVLAAWFHGARWVVRTVARLRLGRRPVRRRRVGSLPRPVDFLAPRVAPLAEGWSGRGPPRHAAARC